MVGATCADPRVGVLIVAVPTLAATLDAAVPTQGVAVSIQGAVALIRAVVLLVVEPWLGTAVRLRIVRCSWA